MQRYVLGFCFDIEFKQLVIIRKQRPEWQRGLINVPGGKIEPGESDAEAISREFKEETGEIIGPLRWDRFALMHEEGLEPAWEVVCFRALDSDLMKRIGARAPFIMTGEEEIDVINRSDIHGIEMRKKTIPNLQWLTELACDWHPGRSHGGAVVTYPKDSQ